MYLTCPAALKKPEGITVTRSQGILTPFHVTAKNMAAAMNEIFSFSN